MLLCSNKLGDKLDGYQKKKYVCKLIFIFLLGNNIEFGHQEAVNLLASLKFSEKQIVSYYSVFDCLVCKEVYVLDYPSVSCRCYVYVFMYY